MRAVTTDRWFESCPRSLTSLTRPLFSNLASNIMGLGTHGTDATAAARGSYGEAMSIRSERAVDYSVVLPVYYNEGSLRPTTEALKKEVISKHPELTCEIIFVDDGSGDGSLQELHEIRRDNPGLVTIIKLSRNFGQPSARLAGLTASRGKCVISMSADEQDPVDLINDMLAAHLEDGYQVVICSRKGRDEALYRVITSRVFYWLMRKLCFPNMPRGGFDYVLLGRKPLNAILQNREAHPFLQGQILWTGFRPKFIEYHRRERRVGRSRWTFGKKVTLLIDGVLSYSFLPIRLIALTGMTIAILGFLYAILVVYRRLFLGTEVPGWAGLAIIVLVMGGVQMLMLGIIGEYLWRTLAQSRRRDLYVIEEIYGDSPD
jgi:dolichol-phosphate mannosyltransferase